MISTKTLQKMCETRFDTSNFELDKPLLKGKNKEGISIMKDELGGNDLQ